MQVYQAVEMQSEDKWGHILKVILFSRYTWNTSIPFSTLINMSRGLYLEAGTTPTISFHNALVPLLVHLVDLFLHYWRFTRGKIELWTLELSREFCIALTTTSQNILLPLPETLGDNLQGKKSCKSCNPPCSIFQTFGMKRISFHFQLWIEEVSFFQNFKCRPLRTEALKIFSRFLWSWRTTTFFFY